MKVHPFFKGVIFIWVLAGIVGAIIGSSAIIEYIYRITNGSTLATAGIFVFIASIYSGTIAWLVSITKFKR